MIKMMPIRSLCTAELDALNQADLKAAQSMFPSDGTVVSPLQGNGIHMGSMLNCSQTPAPQRQLDQYC